MLINRGSYGKRKLLCLNYAYGKEIHPVQMQHPFLRSRASICRYINSHSTSNIKT